LQSRKLKAFLIEEMYFSGFALQLA